MSNERRETTPISPVFPIPPENIWKAVDWMNDALNPIDPRRHDTEVDAFWTSHGDFFDFAKGMARCRATIDRLPADNIKSYQRGFIFALKALNKCYQEVGRDLPIPSPDEMGNYLESYFANGDDDADLLALKVHQHVPSDQKFGPEMVVAAFRQGQISPELRERLTKAYRTNTVELLKDMRMRDSLFNDQLRSKLFFEPHGPNPGLAHGTLDGYQLIYQKEQALQPELKRQSEIEILNRMWNVDIK